MYRNVEKDRKKCLKYKHVTGAEIKLTHEHIQNMQTNLKHTHGTKLVKFK